MIGLFLPRQRVVSLLCRSHHARSVHRNRPIQPVARICRSAPLALIRNSELDRSGDVSAHI
ncbi:hypothetical protein FHS20_002444 [Phyllobacterium endophyticum]|nr:hypothetical protein [Phyllobacterium endophyticum]